jgi:hypothetical protein
VIRALAATVASGLWAVAPAIAAAPKLSFPTDPFISSEWGLYNTGQTIAGDVGKPGIDIHAPEAWTVTHGSRSIKVAVIDTGIDATAPDLAPNVDVADGRNWVDPGTPPTDADGHGTAMASIIGAAGDNHLGMTGVDWQVSIFAEKVFSGAEGGGPDNDVSAVEDAVAKGARVVNISFTSFQPTPALDAAMAAAPNTLFVISAGNSGNSESVQPSYPCVTSPGDPPIPNKLCVAAVDNTGALEYDSSYSPTSVDVAAPGEEIAQIMPPGTRGPLTNGNGYGYGSGTSPAAAMVSGIAALLLAHDAALTGVQLRDQIRSTVDPDPSLNGKVATGGIVDAGRALGVAAVKRPRLDGEDHLLGRSAKPMITGPPTGRCIAAGQVVLRFHGAYGQQVETVAIAVAKAKAKSYFPPQNEHPITVKLPGKRNTVTITIDDTAYRPYYATLTYRRCE